MNNLTNIFLVLFLLGWGSVAWGQDCFGVIGIEVNTTSPCTGTTVQLRVDTINTDGHNLTFDWSHNPENEDQAIVNSGILAAGENEFSVTVTSSSGTCIAVTVTTTITATPREVNLSGVETSYCIGDDVTVTATVGDNDTCEWLFEGNSIGINTCNLEIIDIQSSGFGDYTLRVTSPTDCTLDTTINIEQGNLQELTLEMPSEPLCIDDSPFSLSPNHPNGTYTVFRGLDSLSQQDINSFLSNNSFSPSDAGIGQYSIIYDIEENCYAPAIITFSVNGLAELTLSPAPENMEICQGANPFSLVPSNLGGVYSVSLVNDNFPDGIQLNSGQVETLITNNLFSPIEALPGTYTITYNIDCYMTSNSVEIVVKASIELSLMPETNAVCVGSPCFTLGPSEGGGEYDVSFTGTGSGNINNVINGNLFCPDEATAGMYTIEYSNDNNADVCYSPGSTTITVAPLPAVFINETEACVGASATLEAVVEGGIGNRTFTWNHVNGNVDEVITPILEAGSLTTYMVTVSFDASTGCSNVTDDEIVKPLDTPVPLIEVVGDTANLCADQEVILLAVDGDGDDDKNSMAGIVDAQWRINGMPISEENGGKELVYIGRLPSGTESVNIRFNASNMGCNGTGMLKLNYSTSPAPEPAIIFHSPVNDILVYNDDTACSYQWGFYGENANGIIEFEELPGDTFQSYIPVEYDPENKTYWCRAGDCGTGCSTLAVKSGSNEAPVDVQPPFLMYPNPTSSRLNVEINRLVPEAIYDLRIFNNLGQLVKTMELRAKGGSLTEEIDVSAQQEGVYHLTLVREGQFLATWPFVIQR